MTSGGPRVRSGPPPDPNALRRDRDKAAWTHLPAAGRQGPAPAWPLSRPSKRELELWAGEWRRPQAVMWEANGQQIEVALYVRSLKDAERPRAGASIRNLVKQQQEYLGLSLPGLARNHWIIAAADDAPLRMKVVGGTSAKERVRGVLQDA